MLSLVLIYLYSIDFQRVKLIPVFLSAFSLFLHSFRNPKIVTSSYHHFIEKPS